MLAIKFEGCNAIYGSNQAETYEPLPAQTVRRGQVSKVVLTCWEFNAEERKAIAEGKPLWVAMETFGNPLQPILLTTNRPQL